MSVIGFDLGSQSCRVAVARGGGIETVDNEYSERSTCTTVSFGTRQRYLGASAKNQVVTNAKNSVVLFKHLLGRKFSDPYVQRLKKSLSCELVQLLDDEIGIQVNYLGEDRIFTPVQVTAMMLHQLKQTTSVAIKGKVTDIVLSVPSFFSDSQRRALLDAVTVAGLNCLRLLNDTTASALAYGIYKQDLPAEEEAPRNVVFVDFGHTSLQVAVVAYKKGKLEIKAKAFDAFLGGHDFDNRLLEHFAKVILEKDKIDSFANVRRRLRLLTQCEKVKKQMSANLTPVPFSIECFEDDRDVSGRIQKSEFEELCADLLQRLRAPLVRVLEQAKLTKEDIYSVEIVGGSTRIPAVKDLISEVYGMPISTTLNQDEAVTRGCALQCAMLAPTFRVRDFSVADIQPFPIKLNWKQEENEETGEMILFKEGSAINASKVMTMYRRAPFPITASYHDPACVPSGQQLIGNFSIMGVEPTPEGGASKVKVKARSNIHGIFSVLNATLYQKVEGPPPPPPATEQPQPSAGSSEQEPPQQQPDVPQEMEETAPTQQQQTDGGPQSPPEKMQEGEGQSPQDPGEGDEKSEAQAGGDGPEPKKLDTEGSGKAGGEGKKEEDAPKKKQLKTIALTVDAVTFSLPKSGMDKVLEAEGNMQVSDKQEADKVVAKNSLEEYVYDIREKLDTGLREFVTEQDREALSALLQGTEDWLYGDGEDETKTAYQNKLKDLKKLGTPIAERCVEFEVRPAAFNQLAQAIVHYEKIVALHKEGDELYNHIEAEEMKKVEDDIQKRRQWMHEKSQAQSVLPKHVDPVVKVSSIQTEIQLINVVCKGIVTKPKPKAAPPKTEEEPKKEGEEEPKKEGEEEGKKEEPKEGEQDAENMSLNSEQQEKTDTTAPEEDMDVD